MQLGLTVYEGEFSTEFQEMIDNASTITLKKPAFPMKPVAKSTFENVEIGEQKVEAKKKAAAEAEKTALSLTASDVVEQDIDVDYKPIKEQDIPDQFQVTFKT